MSRKDTTQQQNARPLAVDTKTAAEMLGLSYGTLANWRCVRDGYRGPKYAKVGGKILYPVADLERYLAEHTVAV